MIPISWPRTQLFLTPNNCFHLPLCPTPSRLYQSYPSSLTHPACGTSTKLWTCSMIWLNVMCQTSCKILSPSPTALQKPPVSIPSPVTAVQIPYLHQQSLTPFLWCQSWLLKRIVGLQWMLCWWSLHLSVGLKTSIQHSMALQDPWTWLDCSWHIVDSL